jgi:hypothetical protein
MKVFSTPGGSAPATVSGRQAHRVAIALGACLLVVTLANLAVLWWDVQVGAPQWELAATSQTFERVPLVLLSLLLVGLAGVYGESVGVVRFAAVACGVVTVVVVGLALLYGLAVLQAYSAIPALARRAFKASAVKNVVTTGLYVVTSGYMGFGLWRAITRAPMEKR